MAMIHAILGDQMEAFAIPLFILLCMIPVALYLRHKSQVDEAARMLAADRLREKRRAEQVAQK